MKYNKTNKEEVTEELEPLVALIRDIKRKQSMSDQKNDKLFYANEAKKITINWKKNKETSLTGEEENGL